MESEKLKNIELKSVQLNEVLSKPPRKIIRYGNIVFFLLIVLLLFVAWLIEYPDEILGKAVVTSSKPPIELRNQQYFKLEALSVKENQTVKKNDFLAQFNYQADPNSITLVKAYLNSIENSVNEQNMNIKLLSEEINLGLLQENYTRLTFLIAEWNNLNNDLIFEKQIESIQNEITFRERLKLITSRKMKIAECDYALIKDELEASERLSNENLISKQNLNQEKRNESQAFQSVQNQKEAYLQNMITLNSLRKQVEVVKNDSKIKKAKYISDMQLAIVGLNSAINDWEKNAFWLAPCDGKVLFNTHLQVNKYYKADEASIVIVPKGNEMIALATIQTAGAGKVKKGQQTFIELENYPKNEFGLLEGKVNHVTAIDNNGNYEVIIGLPKQLVTTYKKKIPYQVKLNGSVKIITKKKRLIERFFEKMISLIKI